MRICDDLENIKKYCVNKKIFLWGAGVLGCAILKSIYENLGGIEGIIDNKASEMGKRINNIPILMPASVFSNYDISEMYIIITATGIESIKEIIECCKNMGLKENNNFILLNNKKNIYIDISGKCNLRCKSCQVCNHSNGVINYEKRSFMKPELFKKIVKKLKVDFPENKCIHLYNFGEPTLSPYLPDIIQIIRDEGLLSIISTNLSNEKNIDKIVKAQPDNIKVSLSGFTQDIYKTTHNGGDIRLVKSNLYRIRYLLDKFKLNTTVLVGYHIYNNNNGGEYEHMKNLCNELGYLFQPKQALYCNMFKRIGIEQFSKDDIQFIQKYYDNYNEILNPKVINEDITNINCNLLDNGLFIDYDGKIILCCSALRDDAKLDLNYLDNSIEYIQEERRKNYICNFCKRYGFQY